MKDPRSPWKGRIKQSLKRGIESCLLGGVLFLASCKNSSNSNTENPNPEDPISPTAYVIDQKKGNDENTGTGAEPWKTIAKANAQLKKGDIVYIRTGAYEESISPINNGSEENPIRYENYPHEIPVIRGKRNAIAALALGGKEGIQVKGIHIIKPHRRYADLTGASYCTLEDMVMDKIGKEQGVTLGTYGTSVEIETSYNTIAKCTIFGYPKDVEGVALETVSLFYNAHHNLIQECEIINADHVGLNFKGSGDASKAKGPHHNVVRSCTIINPLHHAVATAYGVERLLFEDNNIMQAGDGRSPENDGEGIHLAPLNSIFRSNVITFCGSTDIENRLESGLGLSWNTFKGRHYFSGKNKFCHNVIFRNRGPGIGIAIGITPDDCHQYPDALIQGSEFVNNIITANAETIRGNNNRAEIFYRFWQSKECVKKRGLSEVPIPQDSFRNNIIGSPGQKVIRVEWPGFHGFYTLESAAEFLPIKLESNFSANPLFVNPANDDYTLKAESPAKNNGSFLTYAENAAAPGSELKVKDARYFIGPPQWDHIPADVIQIGAQRSRIEEIDYTRNRIRLKRPLSWEKGQGISLPYDGEAPSIGLLNTSLEIDE